jgi:hypothetical protein
MRSATQAPMIARRGNMQTAPIAPVKVLRGQGPALSVLTALPVLPVLP